MAMTIKEIIIMLLICLVTMLLLAIALYQYIPNRKIVPEITTYVATEDVQDLLEDTIDTQSDKDNVILTYEVTSSDLRNYQKTNTYVPGKSNPFAVGSSTTTTGEDGSTQDGETSSSEGNSQGTPSTTETSSKTNSSSTEEKSQEMPSVYTNNSGTK